MIALLASNIVYGLGLPPFSLQILIFQLLISLVLLPTKIAINGECMHWTTVHHHFVAIVVALIKTDCLISNGTLWWALVAACFGA